METAKWRLTENYRMPQLPPPPPQKKWQKYREGHKKERKKERKNERERKEMSASERTGEYNSMPALMKATLTELNGENEIHYTDTVNGEKKM